MNIIHLESSPGWGGQEMRIVHEALGMQSHGHRVVIVCEKKSGLYLHAKKSGLKVYTTPFKKIFWAYSLFALLYIFVREKIHVVHTHSSCDAWLGGMAAKVLFLPVIRTRHLSTAIKKGVNSIILYNWLADFVVTTCSGIIPMIARQSKARCDRIRSIPTGIDVSAIRVTPEEKEKFRQTFSFSDSFLYVGTACFMRSWKGIDDLLDAAFMTQHMPLRWVIIGGGHEGVYRKKAQELQLKNVLFTGHLVPPYAAIASLDVFTLLSTAHEGVSQAILQAAFLAKPLIATAIGGLSEVCIDQKTGITVSPHNPKSVVEAVTYLFHHPLIRKRMGEAAKNVVLQNFTYDHMLQATEEIYLQLRSKKE
ncbi:MAG: glycosyltransferase family 4 protein [Parachlamydiales bacterium]|nr:glycosyltransferase family 4 protein [Parachlamydiales bacterium]